MLKQFTSFFTNRPVAKRILITLGLIVLFKLGTLITVPGAQITNSIDESNSFFGILDLLGGGGLTSFSIFALGITPYITAGIIVQLLSSDVIPWLSNLKKHGEKGRVKQEKVTRALAIAFAVMQALAIIISFEQSGIIIFDGLFSGRWTNIIVIALIMTSGTMVTMWVADKITMFGIGNGTSMIIFIGIISTIPNDLIGTYDFLIGGSAGFSTLIGTSHFIMFLVLSFSVVLVMSFFETSYRKIPIQQTGTGLNLIDKKQTFLPIKTNPAGIVPVIFSSALITIVPMIAQFFPETNVARNWITTNFNLSTPFGISLYSVLIILFSLFYAHININSEEISKNFQKNSTFILGVKPGETTQKYLSQRVTSMSIVGAIVLTLIAITPNLMEISGVPEAYSFGGTSSIIAISVAIDIWENLKARVFSERSKKAQIKKISQSIDLEYKGKAIFS